MASTGIAATHVDGCTVHSAMGIGIPSSWSHFGKIFNMDKVSVGLFVLVSRPPENGKRGNDIEPKLSSAFS
jgi:hypothetical protein